DRCEPSVKCNIIGTIIIHFMLSRETQTVCKENSIVQHRQQRRDQTPYAAAHKITGNLCPGGKAAPKMSRKPHKCHAEYDGAGLIFLHRLFSLSPSACSLRLPASLLSPCTDSAPHPTYPECGPCTPPTAPP